MEKGGMFRYGSVGKDQDSTAQEPGLGEGRLDPFGWLLTASLDCRSLSEGPPAAASGRRLCASLWAHVPCSCCGGSLLSVPAVAALLLFSLQAECTKQ